MWACKVLTCMNVAFDTIANLAQLGCTCVVENAYLPVNPAVSHFGKINYRRIGQGCIRHLDHRLVKLPDHGRTKTNRMDRTFDHAGDLYPVTRVETFFAQDQNA